MSNAPKSEEGGPNLTAHPLVAKQLAQAGGMDPGSWVTLIGYVGPSSKPDNVRVYTGLDFQSYYEVPRAAVGLAEPVDAGNENSPTRVLIKAEATISVVYISKRTGAAAYLLGSIVGMHLAAALQASISHFAAQTPGIRRRAGGFDDPSITCFFTCPANCFPTLPDNPC